MKISDIDFGTIPDEPGVYFFCGKKESEILYIGKATSLRDRVRSYFSNELFAMRGPLLVDMITKSIQVRWVTTSSVLEALLLESEYIKKHQPLYNTKEKDNKSYSVVVITREAFPRIFIEREHSIKHTPKDELPYTIDTVFGPYTSRASITEALRIIRKIFPFREGKSKGSLGERFYSQLGLLPSTTSTDAESVYASNIRNIKLFLKGKKKDVVNALEKSMKAQVRLQKFEEAARIRNQIYAIEHINDMALIKKDETLTSTVGIAGARPLRIEAYDIAHLEGRSMIGVMVVLENGFPAKNEYRTFNIRGYTKANDTGALREVLERRLKHHEWALPDLIVLDGAEPQYQVARSVLRDHGLTIPCVSIVKNDKHKPERILATPTVLRTWKEGEMLLANSEAHRYAISRHRAKERSVVPLLDKNK